MTEKNEKSEKNNQLVTALREGVGLVQMLLYKELRERLRAEQPARDQMEVALLAGAITGEVFAARNPDEKFVEFRKMHWAEIEQELLFLQQNHTELCLFLTDALRIQVLCDYHENINSAALLHTAQRYGYLDTDRETPLPSSFMTNIRKLGSQNGLIIPPVTINSEQDKKLMP